MRAALSRARSPNVLSIAVARAPIGRWRFGDIASQKKLWFQTCAALLNSFRLSQS
jgi:hypothetical protein